MMGPTFLLDANRPALDGIPDDLVRYVKMEYGGEDAAWLLKDLRIANAAAKKDHRATRVRIAIRGFVGRVASLLL